MSDSESHFNESESIIDIVKSVFKHDKLHVYEKDNALNSGSLHCSVSVIMPVLLKRRIISSEPVIDMVLSPGL